MTSSIPVASKTKKVTYFLWALLLLIVLAGVYVTYFFVKNDAPIIKGKVIYNVEYKVGRTLDIYLPTKDMDGKRTPVVLFFHGGAWFMGSKESININRINGAVNVLRNKGYTIVSANYTLAKKEQAPFPGAIEDAYDALNWITENRDAYGFDLGNVGVIGESAGAHIGLMLTYTDSSFEGRIKRIPINYMVDIYGPTNLDHLYYRPRIDSVEKVLHQLPEGLRERVNVIQYMFGFDPSVDSARTKSYTEAYSPICYVREGLPRTLLIHGVADQVVPVEQSYELEQSLRAEKISVLSTYFPKVDHAFIGADDMQREIIQNTIVDFIVSDRSLAREVLAE